jgi:hypothetical protein
MIDTNRLATIKNLLQKDYGDFSLFALLLREDAPGKWDLVVAAPWIDKDKPKGLRTISDQVSAGLSKDDLLELSRIIVLDPGSPALEAMLGAVSITNSQAEIKDSNFFGLQIKHAIIFESKRLPAVSKEAGA